MKVQTSIKSLENGRGGRHVYRRPRRKSLAERLAEYNNQLTTFHYDWGEPKGKELL